MQSTLADVAAPFVRQVHSQGWRDAGRDGKAVRGGCQSLHGAQRWHVGSLDGDGGDHRLRRLGMCRLRLHVLLRPQALLETGPEIGLEIVHRDAREVEGVRWMDSQIANTQHRACCSVLVSWWHRLGGEIRTHSQKQKKTKSARLL